MKMFCGFCLQYAVWLRHAMNASKTSASNAMPNIGARIHGHRMPSGGSNACWFSNEFVMLRNMQFYRSMVEFDKILNLPMAKLAVTVELTMELALKPL